MAKDPDKLVQRQLLLMAAAIGLFACGVMVSGATIFSVGTAKSPKNGGEADRVPQAQSGPLALNDTRPESQFFEAITRSFRTHEPSVREDLDWRSPLNEPKSPTPSFAAVNWSTANEGYGPVFRRDDNTGFSLSPFAPLAGSESGYSSAERSQGEFLVSNRFTFGR